MLFDGYLAVDWSANSKPKRGKDSIWIAGRGWGEAEEPQNPGTRAEAVAWIEKLLRGATEAGQRLLCGFDFPFGYPKGTARMLTGRDDWEAVWSRIAEKIKDGPAHVLAEIYPSLIEPAPGPEVKDARQVRAVAAALETLDRNGALAEHLSAPKEMPAVVCEEEGLILGMHDPNGFQEAACEVRGCS